MNKASIIFGDRDFGEDINYIDRSNKYEIKTVVINGKIHKCFHFKFFDENFLENKNIQKEEDVFRFYNTYLGIPYENS